jgi:hypothetical protein
MLATKRIFSAIALSLCIFSTIFAQKDAVVPKMEWDKFSVEDLKSTVWENDTSAIAAVLGNIGQLNMEEVRNRYGFHFMQLKRIKIFKKEGFDYANVTIPYYAKDDIEFVDKVKAHTITPDGYRHAVDTKSIVREKLNDKMSVMKFTFPKVTEGCILEYEMDMYSTHILELREWYFQEAIPTRLSVLHLDLYSHYAYQYLFQGERNLKSTEVTHDYRDHRTRVSFWATDLSAMKEEKFVTSVDNHLTRIRFQLSQYINQNTGAKTEVLSTWQKTAEDLLSGDGFGKKFTKKSNYNKVLEAAKDVVNPTDSACAKAQKLYDWVNANITWNGRYYLWSDQDPNDTWQKRKGGSSDINFLLLALLKEAGLTAHPVLVSTRKNGKPFLEYPIIDQFNHAFVLVDLGNNQTVFLDAGNSALPMGLPSEQALNDKGWVLKKKDPIWIDIKPSTSTQAMIAQFEITEDGHFKGTINASFRGHIAAEQRNIYEGDTTGKTRIGYFKKKNADWQIEEITPTNLDKPNESFKETIKCTIANAVQENGDLLYVKPTIMSGWEINPFKNEKRTYPVEFPYPTNDQYILTLTIPDGYKVEELPKSISLSLPPRDAQFIYQVAVDGKTIRLSVKIQVNKLDVPVEEYAYLRNFFSQVSAKLGEMIVLKKG